MSDRKYRHHGYQDDDRDRERQQRERPKTDGVKRYDGAPRGRGLGTPTTVAFKCARCGHELADPKIDKDTTCTSCGSALHSCTNCSHFNTGALFECQDQGQRVHVLQTQGGTRPQGAVIPIRQPR